MVMMSPRLPRSSIGSAGAVAVSEQGVCPGPQHRDNDTFHCRACCYSGRRRELFTESFVQDGAAGHPGTEDAPRAAMRLLMGTGLHREKLLVSALIGGMVLVIVGAAWHFSLPDPGSRQPAVHLYAGNEPIGVIYPTHRAQSWVALDQIPRPVVDAVLVAEDRRFWKHPGVDPMAVFRALTVNIRRHEVKQGASTITQQVARTVFLDTRRTWSRKLSETAIALLLEVRYSKARILEAYLNTVYLGQAGEVPIYGVPAAARHYLDKDVTALDLDEAAWLAGSIRAPNRLLVGSRAE